MKETKTTGVLDGINVPEAFKTETLEVEYAQSCSDTKDLPDLGSSSISNHQDTKGNIHTFEQTNVSDWHHPNCDNFFKNTIGSSDLSCVKNPHSLAEKKTNVLKSSTYECSIKKLNDNRINLEDTIMKVQEVQFTDTFNSVTNNNGLSNTMECTNLLKKYDYTKAFINDLYLKKYQELEKRLEEQSQQHIGSIQDIPVHRTETADDGCGVSEKEQMIIQRTVQEEEAVIIDSSSDSGESILEVPIPPKPQPPVINLQDSDDEETAPNDDECINVTQKNSSPKTGANDPTSFHCYENEPSEGLLYTRDFMDASWNVEEDMILNCTEVQKGASSIDQIREMGKIAQDEQEFVRRNNEYLTFGGNSTTDTQHIDLSRDKSEMKHLKSKQKQNLITSTRVENKGLLRRKRPLEDNENFCDYTKQKKVNEVDVLVLDVSHENMNCQSGSADGDCGFLNDVAEKEEAFDLAMIRSKMSKDSRFWRILDEDLMPCPRRQRFWNVRCTQCQQEGHVRQNCPVPRKLPKCRVCGATGHMDTRCPQKMCLTCGKKQGTFRKTCESCRVLYCNMCKSIGHKLEGCPDLWRRFHQTTQSLKLNAPADPTVVMKPPNLLVCCNCTKRGHDASTCRDYRWSQHFPTPAFVSNYTDGPQYETFAPGETSKTKKNRPSSGLHQEAFNPTTSTEVATGNKKSTTQKEKLKVLFVIGAYNKKLQHKDLIMNLSSHEPGYHLNELKQGRVKPTFLETILLIIPFLVKIQCGDGETITLTITASPEHVNFVCTLLTHWLQLEDDEKESGITVSVPRKKMELLYLLESRLPELGEIFVPDEVWSEIVKVRGHLANIQNYLALCKANKYLTDLKYKIVRMYQTKPRLYDPFRKLYDSINELEKLRKEKVGAVLYLKILILYNKILMPYVPPQMEERLTSDRTQWGQEQLQPNGGRCKRYIDQLNRFNNALAKKNKRQIEIRQYDPSTSSNDDYSSTRSNMADIITEKCMWDLNNKATLPTAKETQQNKTIVSNTVTTTSNALPVVRSQCNSIPGARVKNTTDNATSRHTSTEIGRKPLLPHPYNNVPISNPGFSSRQDNNPSIAGLLGNRTASPSKNLPSTSELRPSSGVPQSDNKRKSENAKKYTNVQLSPAERMEREAKELILRALEFDIPYIIKPAMEIEKKLKENSLKPKHIQALRKLVKLEMNHQKYLSTFYEEIR